jgi:hypothetical protein
MARREFVALAVLLAACGGSAGEAGPLSPEPPAPPPVAGSSAASSAPSITSPTATTGMTAPPTSGSAPAATIPPAAATSVVGEVPVELLAVVLAHAAGIVGKDASALTVTRAEFVEWPDGSLGCPEPGMLYPQVITPGYRVEVTHPGGTLDFRLTEEGALRVCEAAVPPDLTTPTTMGAPDS